MSDQTTIEERWPDAVVTASGLRYVVTQTGSGTEKPKKGATIAAHYKGSLLDDSVFDSSYKRGQPLAFQVGIGQVIPGWDEALLDMTQGEKRTLIIPPALGYGSRGAPPVIPGNATLVFEVEMVSIK